METRRKRRRRRRAGPVLLTILFVAVALVAGYKCLVRPPETDVPSSDLEEEGSAQETAQSSGRKDYFYTILVYGTDDDNGGSDTNILVGFDGKNGTVNCVSIPRDTAIHLNGKTPKFNYAFNSGGHEQARESAGDMLGIPVDFYVGVDLQGFVELVDAIGGVDFEVPIDMNYDDPYQNLSIHFSKGMQHLDGKDALKVVRFRHNNNGSGYGTEDIGRIGTQQAFLKTVAQKMLQPGNLVKVGDYVKIFQQYVDTNLKLSDMAWFGEQLIGMGTVSFYTLPGAWSDSRNRYILDADATLDMVNRCLNPYVTDRTAEDLDLVQ
jgi:LCP family protein required for cell wall assembly